jgi:hypothetical protein
VVGAATGIIALSTTSAFAHYCYRTDVPEGSKAANGTAWHTKAEAMEMFAQLPFPAECTDRIVAHIASLPDGTLIMGPGLLAGGAIPQGKGPDGMGHLAVDAMAFPECAFLAEGE